MAAKRIVSGHKRRGQVARAYDPRIRAARQAAYQRRIAGARRTYQSAPSVTQARLVTSSQPFAQPANADGRVARSWGGLP